MGTRAFKDKLYPRFADVAAALGSPKRFELLELLAQSERSVEDLARETDLSIANASQHLRKLHAAHLVESRREGTFVHYRLASREIARLLRTVVEIAEGHDAGLAQVVQRHLGERSGSEITAEELMRRLDDPLLIVLDVRPLREYRAGHIAGAQTLPVDELAQRRQLPFPKRAEIVPYCRGRYCTFADEAVTILRRRGYRARSLRVGVPEWEALGLEVSR